MAGSSHHDEQTDHFYSSFVDLLVGVIFLFMLIMMGLAVSYKDKEHDFDKTADALINIDWARRDLLRAIAERMKQRGYTLIVDMENGIVRLPEDLLFDSGQWKLNERGVQAIAALADVFGEVLPCGVEARNYPEPTCKDIPRTSLLESVFIEGHTDKQPYNAGGMTNWELSAFRAITVYRTLVDDQPVLEKRLLNRNNDPVLSVSAYAERRPVDTINLDPNRRIDIRLNLHAPNFKDVVKFIDHAPVTPVPPQGEWHHRCDAEGVLLGLHLNGEPIDFERWAEFQSTAVLLDDLEVVPVNLATVRIPYRSIIALQDYDAVRLGLPRWAPCDVVVQLDGRPESARMQVRVDFLPHEQYRAWDGVQVEGGMLYHYNTPYRLRPAQLTALAASRIVSQPALHAFDTVLLAYKQLYDMRHMLRGDGARVEGYLPRLMVDPVHYFRLFQAQTGFLLRPYMPHEPNHEPVTVLAQRLKPWSALWQDEEIALPHSWVMPEHHYIQLTPEWHAILSVVRPHLRKATSVEAAHAVLTEHLTREMLHAIR